ncbi:MAG: PEP-CTERM sorting domain-containing protein [Acidobacteriia bacterium]|nr:PEP-CTERM sorting domain-containing protein [Terriglobia bacterium]
MNAIKRTTLYLAIGCLSLFLSSTPSQASVVGLCAGWMPSSLTADCTLATPSLDIGTTSDPNPTFGIALNAKGSAADTILLILVPGSTSSMTFTANFTQGFTTHNVASGSGLAWTSGNVIQGLLGLTVANGNGGPNDYSINGGAAALSGVQSVPNVTSYRVFALDTQFGLSGTNTANPKTISVSFSNGTSFPAGTIFLAIALNSRGTVTYTTPLTLGNEELSQVPEPATGTLAAFGAALLALGGFLRRRYLRGEVIS